MSETGVKYDKGFLCQILLLPNVMSETGRNLSYYQGKLAKDPSSQNMSSQDKSSQDRSSQDRSSQDRSSQDRLIQDRLS